MADATQPLQSAAPMPPPEVYEREYAYWPWGKLISTAIASIVEQAPHGAIVADYMCGTGFLLNQLKEMRADITGIGCDIHEPYVTYARTAYPNVEFVNADARTYRPSQAAHVIVCTAGLHHLPFEDQAGFVRKLASECRPDSLVLIGEEAVPPYVTATERKSAVLALSSSLIAHGIEHEWPNDMLAAAIEVMHNDLTLRGEFKRDYNGWLSLLEAEFYVANVTTTWAAESGGGDTIFLCRPLGSSRAP